MTDDALTLMDTWGPEKVVYVSDRRTGMRGVLVLENSARGMGKGGPRMSPTLIVREVARLARTMTSVRAVHDADGLDIERLLRGQVGIEASVEALS